MVIPGRFCPESCLECALLTQQSCDGTNEDVRVWCEARRADPAPVLRYLERGGGFCSCEVLMNALDRGRLILDDLVLACGR